jgi:phosphonoacetaldehyde hydrolase
MDIFIRNRAYTGPIRAVVLDWAGTAIDYGCMGPIAALIDVFGAHGVEVTTAEARRPMGLHKKDHIRAMCRAESVAEKWRSIHQRLPTERDVETLYREVEPMMASTAVRHSDPIPGLLNALTQFDQRGIRVGSTTGYTRPIMDILVPMAQEKGFRPEAVVCASDVPSGRPYPFMCYRNAIDLKVHPLEAMVKIGDTVSDIEEGLNAGMWTIGLTMTGNELGLTEKEVMALDPVDLAGRRISIEERFRNAGAHFVAKSIGHCTPIIDEIDALLKEGAVPGVLRRP